MGVSSPLSSSEVALTSQLLIFAILFSRIGDYVLVCGNIILGIVVGVWSINRHWILGEFLVGHDVQRQSRDVGIRVLLTVSQEGDELGHVLLKLSQVLGNVVLIELHVIVVGHVAGHSELESGLGKLVHHGPGIVLDVSHLVLNVLNLGLLLLVVLLHLGNLFLKIGFGGNSILIVHLGVNLVSLDLLLNVSILHFDHVDFTAKSIDVVDEGVVLLFRLDETCDDFLV